MSVEKISVLVAWCFLTIIDYGNVEARGGRSRGGGVGGSVSVSGELSDGIIVLIVSGSLIGLAFVVSMVYSTIKKCQRCCRKYDCCHKCTNCNRIFADEVDADYLEAAEYYLRLRALASALKIDPDSESSKKEADVKESSSDSANRQIRNTSPPPYDEVVGTEVIPSGEAKDKDVASTGGDKRDFVVVIASGDETGRSVSSLRGEEGDRGVASSRNEEEDMGVASTSGDRSMAMAGDGEKKDTGVNSSGGNTKDIGVASTSGDDKNRGVASESGD